MTPTAGITWEVAQVLGMCAVAACLILCVLAVRRRAGADGAFPLRSHQFLGWFALGAVILHIGLLLTADPRVVEHLKLTAPRYEFAGMLATFALIFLTIPASTKFRPRVWPRHRSFQAAHIGAACLLVVAMTIHVVTTDRYVHGHAQRLAFVLLSAVALVSLLRARSGTPPATFPSRLLGELAFGRNSRLIVVLVIASLTALGVLLHRGMTLALREPFFRRSERLVLYFPHDKHRDINCLVCHHNFADNTGADSCLNCHRSRRADLRVGIEARFHDFCLGCHRGLSLGAFGNGPVTGCSTCHRASPSGQ